MFTFPLSHPDSLQKRQLGLSYEAGSAVTYATVTLQPFPLLKTCRLEHWARTRECGSNPQIEGTKTKFQGQSPGVETIPKAASLNTYTYDRKEL
jgi:hypothetical protein